MIIHIIIPSLSRYYDIVWNNTVKPPQHVILQIKKRCVPFRRRIFRSYPNVHRRVHVSNPFKSSWCQICKTLSHVSGSVSHRSSEDGSLKRPRVRAASSFQRLLDWEKWEKKNIGGWLEFDECHLHIFWMLTIMNITFTAIDIYLLFTDSQGNS